MPYELRLNIGVINMYRNNNETKILNAKAQAFDTLMNGDEKNILNSLIQVARLETNRYKKKTLLLNTLAL